MVLNRWRNSGGTALVALAISVGFVLRCATLFWGLPHAGALQGYHPDEPKVWSSIYNFPSIYLTNRNFTYGTAWQYLTGLLLLPVKIAIIVVTKGHWRSSDTYRRFALIAARLFSVFAGTFAIYLTWRLATRLFGRATAVISAILLTVSLYHCTNSAFATLDVPMSCLVLLLFLAMMRAGDDGLASWALCGAVAGVLMGTKVVAILFAAAPLLLIAVKWIAARKVPGGRGEWGRALVVYAGTASIVLFVTTPNMFLHPAEFWTYLLSQKSEWYDFAQSASVVARARVMFDSTRIAVGAPIILASLGGAVLSVRKPAAIPQIALVTIIFYYCFWGGFLAPRYVIVIAPFFCMFAAFFLSNLLGSTLTIVRTATVAILVAMVGFSFYQCVSGIDMRLNDTRPRAAAFIATAISSGTSIGVAPASDTVGWRTHSWRYPLIDFLRYREASVLDRPSIVVVSSYDLEEIEPALRSPKLLSGYRWDARYARDWYAASPPSPALLQFYDRLLHSNGSGYRLIADFAIPQRASIEFPPPEIRIYRREP